MRASSQPLTLLYHSLKYCGPCVVTGIPAGSLQPVPTAYPAPRSREQLASRVAKRAASDVLCAKPYTPVLLLVKFLSS